MGFARRIGTSLSRSLGRGDANRPLVCCREHFPRSSFSWPFVVNLENFPGLASLNNSPKCPRGIYKPWVLGHRETKSLALFILTYFRLSSVPERCNGKPKQTAVSFFFFMRLFKQMFGEKATRNAILRVEIRCFSDCLTYLKQRAVEWAAPGGSDREGSGADVGLCDRFQERGTPCANLKLFLFLSKTPPFLE